MNELSGMETIKRRLLAGLWFGDKKPHMNVFLKPFVEEMNELSSSGVMWTDELGIEHTTRIFPGPCCVDSVARAMVMNMTQFNGAHGCACCHHEGEVINKGNGHVRVYSALSQPEPRTDESFLRHAALAEQTCQPKFGIKYQCSLFAVIFLLSQLALWSTICMLCVPDLSGTQQACGSTTKVHFHIALEMPLLR